MCIDQRSEMRKIEIFYILSYRGNARAQSPPRSLTRIILCRNNNFRAFRVRLSKHAIVVKSFE